MDIDAIMAQSRPTQTKQEKCYRETEEAEEAEEPSMDSLSLSISASLSLCNTDEAIRQSLPSNRSQVRASLFKLARTLKGSPLYADAHVRDLRSIVRAWHEAASSNNGWDWGGWTLEDSYGEFTGGWEKVRFPVGSGPLDEAIRLADEYGPPQEAGGYECPTLRRLAGLCLQLQISAGTDPFYLSCRTAANLLGGIDHMGIWRRIKVMESDGLLEVATKHTSVRATRYYYKRA